LIRTLGPEKIIPGKKSLRQQGSGSRKGRDGASIIYDSPVLPPFKGLAQSVIHKEKVRWGNHSPPMTKREQRNHAATGSAGVDTWRSTPGGRMFIPESRISTLVRRKKGKLLRKKGVGVE